MFQIFKLYLNSLCAVREYQQVVHLIAHARIFICFCVFRCVRVSVSAVRINLNIANPLDGNRECVLLLLLLLLLLVVGAFDDEGVHGIYLFGYRENIFRRFSTPCYSSYLFCSVGRKQGKSINVVTASRWKTQRKIFCWPRFFSCSIFSSFSRSLGLPIFCSHAV